MDMISAITGNTEHNSFSKLKGGEPWPYVAAKVDLDLINVLSAPLLWKRDRRSELHGIFAAQGCNFNEQQFLI